MAQDFKRQLTIACFDLQNGHCYLCDTPIRTAQDLTLDHIWPKAHGGSDLPPNRAVAHWTCNNRKGSREPTTGELLIGELLAIGLAGRFELNLGAQHAAMRHTPKWKEGNPTFETALSVALKAAGFR